MTPYGSFAGVGMRNTLHSEIPMHRAIQFLARLTALVGGTVLIGLIVLTTLSIIGRSVNKFLHADFFQSTLSGFSQLLLDLGVGEINGSYELLFAGINNDGQQLIASVSGDMDPGYGSTSKMITESAVCLLKNPATVAGGIWTPAPAMGSLLIERLQNNAGLTFELEQH